MGGRAGLKLARLPEPAEEHAALIEAQDGRLRRCDRARRAFAHRRPKTYQRLLIQEYARLASEEAAEDGQGAGEARLGPVGATP